MHRLIRRWSVSPAFVYVAPRIMAATILLQGLGLARQILIAGYFGLTRSLDVYYTTLAVATVVVLVLAPLVESVAIPELIRLREESAREARTLAGVLLLGALALSGVLSVILLAGMPLLAPLVSAGFSPDERGALSAVVPAFLPWTLVALPYAALAAIHKSARRYNLVLAAELAISVVATLMLIARHERPRDIALAMGVGYAAAFVGLLMAARDDLRMSMAGAGRAVRRIGRNAVELFAANQVGSLGSIVDRALQSYLVPGAVAAFATTTQLTTNLGTVLTLRDLPIVPLSQRGNRAERLERLLIAMCLLSIPLAFFLHAVAWDLLSLVFKRGRFDEAALSLLASVFAIYVFTVVPATANVPVLRMFQIIDAVKYVGVLNAVSVIVFAALGSLLVIVAGWGVTGMALTGILNSCLAWALGLLFLRIEGVRVRVGRLARHVVPAVLVGTAAAILAGMARRPDAGAGNIAVAAVVFTASFAVGYGLDVRRIRSVLFGAGAPRADEAVVSAG